MSQVPLTPRWLRALALLALGLVLRCPWFLMGRLILGHVSLRREALLGQVWGVLHLPSALAQGALRRQPFDLPGGPSLPLPSTSSSPGVLGRASCGPPGFTREHGGVWRLSVPSLWVPGSE